MPAPKAFGAGIFFWVDRLSGGTAILAVGSVALFFETAILTVSFKPQAGSLCHLSAPPVLQIRNSQPTIRHSGGGIAQLVERQLCKLEVRGSNPLASKAEGVEAKSTSG